MREISLPVALLFLWANPHMGQIYSLMLLILCHDTVCRCIHYSFLHILNPHSKPSHDFQLYSVGGWASNYTCLIDDWKREKQQILSWKGCAHTKPNSM